MTKLINGFINYTISCSGEVRNLRGVLKPSKSNSGYWYVDLSREGKRTRLYIHRLVALHFVVGIGNKVNHKDGDKLNNTYNNLEWCTTAYNTQHAYAAGLIVKKRVDDTINPEDLYDKYKSGYKMEQIAKMFNIGITSVSKYINKYVRENSLADEFAYYKHLSRKR